MAITMNNIFFRLSLLSRPGDLTCGDLKSHFHTISAIFTRQVGMPRKAPRLFFIDKSGPGRRAEIPCSALVNKQENGKGTVGST